MGKNNLDRHQMRIEKENILRRMFDEGASIKEMIEATGYHKSSIGVFLAKFRAEIAQEEHLTFAKHPKPNMPIVEIDGKKYRDMTDAFLSTEWEGSEE